MTAEKEVTRPVAEFSVGGGIKAVVWENEYVTKNGSLKRPSVQAQKRYYCEKSQTWKTSDSYFTHEIPQLVVALIRAYWWIMTHPSGAHDVPEETEA